MAHGAVGSYTREFFDGFRQGSRRSAEAMLPVVFDLLKPSSVVDVGCGVGTWLAASRALGATEILGFDGSYVDTAALEIPQVCFEGRDLKQPLRADRRWDLVISLEVAEHLPEDSADSFIASLTSLGPVVLFSAAIPKQGGTGHLNEQWPEYWAERFAVYGYVPIDCIRPRVWWDSRITWWYRQNTILFAAEAHVQTTPALAKLRQASRSSPLSIVHPEKYLIVAERAANRSQLRPALRDVLKILRRQGKALIQKLGRASRPTLLN